jgi:antitoxin component of MazEF toxin-antitoxin module
MKTVMGTTLKIRKIGNSKGILFPKSILEKSGVTDSVQVVVKNKIIMLSAVEGKKKKWTDFKRKKKERVDLVSTKFDESEWTW